MVQRFLNICVLLYVAITLYLFKGYEDMNDKLTKVNDMLLHTCSKSKLNNIEIEKYK